MKRILVIAGLLLSLCTGWAAQPKEYTITPTYPDIRYGDHKREVLDIWLPKNKEKGTYAVAIFAHGGGFIVGSKENLDMKTLQKLLDNNIAVVSMNYRFAKKDGKGALGCMDSGIRAVQYLRYHAKELHLDKNRMGMFGTSAGSGLTLWMGLHDDMAKPDSEDPLERESTRLQAFYAIDTQANYDVWTWPAIFGIPEDHEFMADLIRVWGLTWLGINSVEERETPQCRFVRKELNMLELITPDDPPFMVANKLDGSMPPKKLGIMIHHPLFAKQLYDRGQELGIPCHARAQKAPKLGINDPLSVADFFAKYLSKKEVKKRKK